MTEQLSIRELGEIVEEITSPPTSQSSTDNPKTFSYSPSTGTSLNNKKRKDSPTTLNQQSQNDREVPKRTQFKKLYSMYDVKYLDKEVYEAAICTMCGNWNMSIWVNRCSHQFCSRCIIEAKVPCKLCGCIVSNEGAIRDFSFEYYLQTSKVKCLANLCKWTGEKNTLESHLRRDCKILIMCACGSIVERGRGVDEHRKECVDDASACELCNIMVAKNGLISHIATECPESVASCCVTFKGQVSMGCGWIGKKMLLQDHIKNCRFVRLCYSLDKSQSIINVLEAKLATIHSLVNSEPFITCGLSDPDPVRRGVISMLSHTYSNTVFPSRYVFGYEERSCKIMVSICKYDDLCDSYKITGTKTTGYTYATLEIVPQNDVNPRAYMVITLQGNFERIFIVQSTTLKTTITKTKILKPAVIMDFEINSLNPQPSMMFTASRKRQRYQDNKECPYCIDISDRTYKSLSITTQPIRQHTLDNIQSALRNVFNSAQSTSEIPSK